MKTIRIGAADLNGQARGKRLPDSYAEKLASGSVRMPLSALNVDIAGADIANSPLVFDSGDADGILMPTGRGPIAMPWLATPSELHPMWMFTSLDTPFAGDPRHALARALERYKARGWSVLAATELEFYLVDAEGRTPAAPGRHAPMVREDVLSLAQLDAFDGFFTDLYDGAAAMDLPAQAAIAESGISQFEVNLNHQDAMRAADDTWLFKMLVKGIARKHGLIATFMAKPFADQAGSGMHVHFSVVDDKGTNLFDNGERSGTPMLAHAIAGCLDAMPASTLIFAPHGISFDRFVDLAHAPTSVAWGFENRTAAIRIPGGPSAARRIEHRVAGGDINPYLLLAVILGAAMNGIDDQSEPPAEVVGNAYNADLPQLASDWQSAIAEFRDSEPIQRIFDPLLIQNLILTKQQEIERFSALNPQQRLPYYLETV